MTNTKKQRRCVLSTLIDKIFKGSQQTSTEEMFTQVANEREEYGWLEPNGSFHVVPWGEHQDFALSIIKSRNWFLDFLDFKGNTSACFGDFLTSDKGWVLIHSPGRQTTFVTRDENKRLTRAQSEFLYGYFADRGLLELANNFLI